MASVDPPYRTLCREERRDRIVGAAKRVFLERGLEASSMDEVAARAGTTKPTVYAHFPSKDALFAAVVELIKGLFLGKLRSPEVYAEEPVEAVSLFCGRFLELLTWGDSVGFQRVALSAAGRFPALAQAVHETLFAAGRRSLAAYLRARKLTRCPEPQAELLLSATTGGAVIRYLYGVDTPQEDLPDDEKVGARVDLKAIRDVVQLIATTWEAEPSP